MTPLDTDIVRRKLAVIARNLEDLAAVEGIDVDEYRTDRFRLKATERLLQELIEAAVDTNLRILRATGRQTPTDYYQSFMELGRAGVIGHALAERLAPTAGLRNRLVHEYDRIDDRVVLEAVAEARRAFPGYVAAVERFLSAEPEG